MVNLWLPWFNYSTMLFIFFGGGGGGSMVNVNVKDSYCGISAIDWMNAECRAM